MCANVARGSIAKALESFINGLGNDSLTILRGALRNPGLTFGQLNAQFKKINNNNPVLDPGAILHLQQDWFDPGPDNYWPHNDNKLEIVRHGLAEAVQLKIDNGMPISILWICAGHHFQVALHGSEHQITLLIMTPHTPHGRGYSMTKTKEELWVIGTKRDMNEIIREAGFGGARSKPNQKVELTTGSTKKVYKVRIYSDP